MSAKVEISAMASSLRDLPRKCPRTSSKSAASDAPRRLPRRPNGAPLPDRSDLAMSSRTIDPDDATREKAPSLYRPQAHLNGRAPSPRMPPNAEHDRHVLCRYRAATGQAVANRAAAFRTQAPRIAAAARPWQTRDPPQL